MDVTTLSQVIGSLGFPIVACIGLWVQIKKLQDTLHELSVTLSLMADRLSDVEQAVKKEV